MFMRLRVPSRLSLKRHERDSSTPPHPPHPIPMFMRLHVPSRLSSKGMNVIVPPHLTHPTPSQRSRVRVCQAHWAKDCPTPPHPPHPMWKSFAQVTLVGAQMTRICVYRWPGSVCTDDRRLCVQMTRICVYRWPAHRRPKDGMAEMSSQLASGWGLFVPCTSWAMFTSRSNWGGSWYVQTSLTRPQPCAKAW